MGVLFIYNSADDVIWMTLDNTQVKTVCCTNGYNGGDSCVQYDGDGYWWTPYRPKNKYTLFLLPDYYPLALV
jgi:hypothetical protein